MNFTELQLQIKALEPTLSAQELTLVELFMPFCEVLVRENAELKVKVKNWEDKLTANRSKPPSKDDSLPMHILKTIKGWCSDNFRALKQMLVRKDLLPTVVVLSAQAFAAKVVRKGRSFSRLLRWGGLFSVLLCFPLGIAAKEGHRPVSPRADYERAVAFIEAFNLDSAAILLDQIILDLDKVGKLQSPFGAKVRLKKAEALEKADRDQAAIQQLLEVAADGLAQQHWEVYTNAQLSVARLHEKHDRPAHCYEALQKAQIAIQDQSLDSLYPRFAIRMSSYHRIFGHKETALYFAKEVIRTAPDFNQLEFLGNGHMLTAMLLQEDLFEASARHFQKAAEIFKSLGNHTGYSAMLCNLASLYKDHQRLDLALTYINTYWTTYNNRSCQGQTDPWTLSNYYKIRSEIMAAMQQYDSAHHYLQLAFDSRLELIRKENRAQVVQIEAQFNDQQKAQKIRDQAQMLQYESTKRKWGIGIALLSLLFTGIILFFHFKLRAVNKKMRQQAKLIHKKNQDLGKNLEKQIMLQGEIHHRVKNNLQVIISLLDFQKEEVQDPKTIDRMESMSNRIYSMAAVHEMLYEREGAETIDFPTYIRQLCAHFRQIAPENKTPVFNLDMDSAPLPLETLMPLGIIMNELMTNSLKYGTIPNQQPAIGIYLQPCADGFCLEYRDNGPGFPSGTLKERQGGLGSYLVRSMVRQLNGNLTTHNDNGAVYKIFFKEKNQRALRHEFISDTNR
jgi:two-component system, sensor histidine kinase PdtaS